MNRLKKLAKIIQESQSATDRVFSDARRIIRGVLAERHSNERSEFKVQLGYNEEYQWSRTSDLPTVVIQEYDSTKS